MMRLIDADALQSEYMKYHDGKRIVLVDVAPTIDPQPEWIPVSERLPNSNGIYNVTRKISDGFECRNIVDTCYFDGTNIWHDDTRINHGREYLTDIVAWMPLPEPWKEEEE